MATSTLTQRAETDFGARLASKPKLLFLACYFPPLQGSACVRTYNIAKYLARLGWDVTVVTPDPSVWRHLDASAERSIGSENGSLRRLLTGHRWRCLSPHTLNVPNHGLGWVAGGLCRRVARSIGIDQGMGWIQEAEKSCLGLSDRDVDLILASGPPFAGFHLAERLARRWRRPYVLDYRDPWVLQPKPGLAGLFGKSEQELVERAAAVTAISTSLLAMPIAGRPNFHVVTNGFDPEEMASVLPQPFDHFAIVYTGIFYPPKRVVTPVMRALRILKERLNGGERPWRFHYYGPQGDHVQAEARRCGVLEHVETHGRVSRAEALSAIRGAGVAIVITSVLEDKAQADKGIVTGKLFDAIGLGTPTVIVGPSGADLETIVETTGLAAQVPASEVERLAALLSDAMSGHTPSPKRPDTYAWPTLIKRLDDILKGCLPMAAGHS